MKIIDHSKRLNTFGARMARLQQTFKAMAKRKFRADVELLSGFIEPGSIVLDIGANHGRVSRELALVHDRSCRVLSFEPVVYNLLVARRVLRSYSNLSLFEIGLSDRTQEIEMLIPVGSKGQWLHGGARLKGVTIDKTEREVLLRQPTQVRRLDEVLQEHSQEQGAPQENRGRVSFIKLDVEGHELAVLEGGLETIRRDRPNIQIEVRPDDCEGLGLLEREGYRFWNLDLQERGTWTDFASVHDSMFGNHNDILCWYPTDADAEPPAFKGAFADTRFG